MKLVFLNPHVNYSGKMVFNWMFGFHQHHKYTHLWQEPLRDKDKKIAFLVDGTQSSFYQTAYFEKTIARIPFLLKIFSYFEMGIWMILNRVNPFKCKVYFRAKKLDPQNDIIFSIGFTSYKSHLQKYKGLVLVNLSHYHLHTEDIYKYLKKLKHGFLVAENDLIKNDYFKHYFPGVKKVYHLPFSFLSGRFKKTKKFNKRINKCFASGPMSVPSSSSYIKYYGEGAALNPMRDLIYKNKESLKKVIDAYIYPHNEALKELKEIKQSDSFFKKWAKKRLPPWVLKLLFNYQLPYFRFDIVEKYNEYKMFMSSEERTGLPSLKILEGMACGSALVAIDDPMYTNIGFKDGVNYIAFKENDLKDLEKKIRYYQNHPKELEKIAENGCKFAISQFLPEKVTNIFWQDLEQLSDSFKKGKPQFESSFKKSL